MLWRLLSAWCLMGLCVVIHAAGITSSLRWLRRRAEGAWQWGTGTWLLILFAGWVILLHLAEISVWAVFYWWRRAIPDLQDAFYFSAVTYTTTGYGDLVLPPAWRLVGGVEALTGILMCAWSTGFFVTIVSRMYGKERSPD